jgi:hypothetical protein
LFVAVFSVMAWIVAAGNFVVLPSGKHFAIPHPKWFWTTALAALYSTACMAAAIIIAIFTFRDL